MEGDGSGEDDGIKMRANGEEEGLHRGRGEI